MVANVNALTSPIWQDFLTVDSDVLPWLQMGTQDVNQSLVQNLQLITSMACDWVQDFLGRPVAPTQFDRRFDGWSGWNGAYLELPYSPVLEVTSVIEYWGVSGPHVLLESTPTAQIDGWQLEPLTGRLIRIFPGNVQKPWFPGSRNIEVVWMAGYNPVPPTIRVATLELIAHWWRNTQQQSAMHAGAEADYDPEESGGPYEGVPDRIYALLSPKTQIGIG
jgi:hypothetical protein